MAFKNKLFEFIQSIPEKKKLIKNEEGTKNGLILPFLQILGYDYSNPNEVIPELETSQWKKGEKVDYGIRINEKIMMIVECKPVNERLSGHRLQLGHYFPYTEAKIGILTNGIKYEFFFNEEDSVKMNVKPFFRIDLEKLKKSDVNDLIYFRKKNFNYNIISEELGLKQKVKEQLSNPSDNFVKVFFPRIGTKKVHSIKPKLKKILSELLNPYTAIIEIPNNIHVEKREDNFNKISSNKINITEIQPTPPNNRSKIKVSFPNGEVIQENNVTNTFIKAIEKIGIDRVKDIGIFRGGINIVSEDKHPTLSQKYLADKQCYIFTNLSTKDKLTILHEIISTLNL